MKRLFLALAPTSQNKKDIADWAKTHLSHLGAPFVAQDNLHLTLVFLGNVTQTQEADLIAQINRLFAQIEIDTTTKSKEPRAVQPLLNDHNKKKVPLISVKLDNIEHWAKPKILCLTPSQIAPALIELANTLQQIAHQLGFESHHARYRPHITLTRKQKEPIELTSQQAACFSLSFSTFSLFESKSIIHTNTNKNGVIYTPLKSWSIK